MEALKSLVQPLVGNVASNSVVDGMKLVVLGGTVETARRISSSARSVLVYICASDYFSDNQCQCLTNTIPSALKLGMVSQSRIKRLQMIMAAVRAFRACDSECY
jgi:hypothetical protein